jgi:hypothetical protein
MSGRCDYQSLQLVEQTRGVDRLVEAIGPASAQRLQPAICAYLTGVTPPPVGRVMPSPTRPGCHDATCTAEREEWRMPNWHNTDWGYKVSTQDELTRAIARIGTLSLKRRYVWRGVADYRWPVNSSLFRSLTGDLGRPPTEIEMRRRELTLIAQAREWGLGISLGEIGTDLQLLASLQHHGVPTRLLDVTSNPMTALWFACQPAGPTRDSMGVLFAIDVTEMRHLDSADVQARGKPWGALEHGSGWSLREALARSHADQQPFLLRPSLPDERMKAQEGTFIGGAMSIGGDIPGVDDVPIRGRVPPGQARFKALFKPSERSTGRPAEIPLCALVIPTQVKRLMRSHLAGTYNRSRRSLFPDIDGFRDALLVNDVALPHDPIPEALSSEEMATQDGLLPEP